MTVRIINKSKHPLPAYATELSAGMDIRANLSEPIALNHLPHQSGADHDLTFFPCYHNRKQRTE